MDNALLWLVIALLFLGVLAYASQGTKSLEHRLARVERKLDLVLGHLGVDEPGTELAGEVEALLRQDKKIVAIKRYREVTGAGLKEAKDAVERISRGETR
ncbi:ribosomal protein L7/L12 [Amycolatopsis samaneae]|uniref:Ribosomal protein L7/L12 n=1 Tax=Amycolatopsis samaneae TaxID=664691 RepID=A0ABW5GQY8_9PSEU